MSKKGKAYAVGEIWFDHAGNECFYRDNGTLSVRTINTEPSMAIQSERDKCDLNIIKAIYDRTGVMNNIRTDAPKYGDFTTACDLHTARLRVQEAEAEFMTLPALVRARFYNDPGSLIDFLADERNREEAMSLGLIPNPVGSPQATQVPQGEPIAPPKEGA